MSQRHWATTLENGVDSILVAADDITGGPRGEHLVNAGDGGTDGLVTAGIVGDAWSIAGVDDRPGVDAFLDEFDGSVAEQEVNAAGVQARGCFDGVTSNRR